MGRISKKQRKKRERREKKERGRKEKKGKRLELLQLTMIYTNQTEAEKKCKRSYVRREKWRRRRWTNTIAAKLTAVTKARMSKPLKNGRRRKRISKKQRKKRERRKKK